MTRTSAWKLRELQSRPDNALRPAQYRVHRAAVYVRCISLATHAAGRGTCYARRSRTQTQHGPRRDALVLQGPPLIGRLANAGLSRDDGGGSAFADTRPASRLRIASSFGTLLHFCSASSAAQFFFLLSRRMLLARRACPAPCPADSGLDPTFRSFQAQPMCSPSAANLLAASRRAPPRRPARDSQSSYGPPATPRLVEYVV